MAKDLVNNPETKLGGTEKPHMDLGAHLEYIESILEQGAGGAGGKSIPPTLNLIDLETFKARTTITEEEKTNLENGLYNQVTFPGLIPDDLQIFMPSKLMGDKSFDVNSFAQFNYVESDNAITINALSIYGYTFGEKDTNGNYPIIIEKQMDFPIGGNSGGGNIWYDLTSLNGNSITQEQYNEIKSLIDGNRLAGIKTVLQFFPLVYENNGEFKFSVFAKDYEQIDSNKKLTLDNIYFTIKPDLSITNNWDSTPVVELTKNLSSQSIPSIKADGYQQNLTIGNGLEIKDGALQATSSGGQVFFNLFAYYDQVNNKITQEGWDKLSNGLINGTYCGILYDELPLIVSGFNGARTLYTFITTEEEDNVSIKITVKSDLTYTIEDVPVLNIPALPSDASSKTYTLQTVNGTLAWTDAIGDINTILDNINGEVI